MSSEDESTAARSNKGDRSSLVAAAAAELAGTALLLLLSCLHDATPPPAPLVAPRAEPLAAGLVVAVIVQCFDHISGAMLNPTVLLASVVRGRVGPVRAAALGAAQLAGALAGAAMVRALATPPGGGAQQCLTMPRADLPLYKAVLVEGVAGGVLALVNCGAWDSRVDGLKDSWPLRIGLAVAGLTYVAGDLTGASMNPVRSLAPALINGNLQHQWVYWVGPLTGSLVCAWLYGVVWAPRARSRGPPAGPPRHGPPPPPPRRRATDSDLDKLAISV